MAAPPLLHRVASGEMDAVKECLARYGGLIWNLSRKFCPNKSEIEDAVQDIFIDLWANAERFNPEQASEATFITMIARRRLIDHLRKKARQLSTLPLDRELDFPGQESSALEIQEEASKVSEELSLLPQDQQQVIRLAIFDGFTHQEIADRLGLPLGTVKTNIRRGLLKVREQLATRGAGSYQGELSS